MRYLTCGKSQSYCAPMSANRLAPGCSSNEVRHICNHCCKSAKIIEQTYKFPVATLAQYLSHDDIVKIDALAFAAAEVKDLDSHLLGVNVGRLALYEFTLAHKKVSTSLTSQQWDEYCVYLVNAMRSLQAFARYLNDFPPQVVFAYSPQYSNINPCTQYAIEKGIKVMFVEGGSNLSHRLPRLRVWDWNVHGLVNPALSLWSESSNKPVTPYSATRVVEHFEHLLAGKHHAVYSAPNTSLLDIRSLWNIAPKQQVILMALSSYDEAFAALLIKAFPDHKVFSDVFRTQIDWIKATIHWVASRPDLFLIIRVHPRDFPNKREAVRSEQSYLLQDLLEHLPDNVHVNWPDQKVSLYQIFEDVDLLTTGWSVTALEALALGIPVVTYDSNLPSYPKDIHYTGRTVDEYFNNIETALENGWSFKNTTGAIRWMAYNFVSSTISLTATSGAIDVVPKFIKYKFWARLWERLKNKIPEIGYPIDLRIWRGARNEASLVSDMIQSGYSSIPAARLALEPVPHSSSERLILLQTLSRVHHLFYPRKRNPRDKPGLSQKIQSFLASEMY